MKPVKKFLVIMAFILSSCIFAPGSIHAADEISVTIEGVRVNFTDQQPAIIGGRTLVPLRGVFEALGFDVEWSSLLRTAYLTKEGYRMSIGAGSH